MCRKYSSSTESITIGQRPPESGIGRAFSRSAITYQSACTGDIFRHIRGNEMVEPPLPAERELEEKSKTDEISFRIQRVTEDLRAIQQELNWAAIQVPANPEQREALSELVEAESLQALKSALDQMRHFLWFFIQVVSNESEFGEKLREVLRQRVANDVAPGKTTFLEKLKMATDHALVRYLLENKNQKPN